MMPRSLIEAASSSSSVSEKLRRGLRGLGLKCSIGTRRRSRARSGVAFSAPMSPMSAARPRPNRDRPSSAIAMSPECPRLLFVEHDLFRKPVSTFRDHALSAHVFVFTRSCRAGLRPRTAAAIAMRARNQFLLALDDLGREPQIGFAADAFEIVDQHRL